MIATSRSISRRMASRRSPLAAFVYAVCLLSVPAAWASVVVQIDFASPAPVPVPGVHWNMVSNAQVNTNIGNLVDTNTGNATAIGLEQTGFAGPATLNWGPGGVDPDPSDWVVSAAGGDGFTVLGGPASVLFTGLDDSFIYRFDVVAAASSTFFDGADYQINGDFGDDTNLGTPPLTEVGDNWPAFASSFLGEWMIWENVTSSGGEAELVVTPQFGNAAMLNAVRIQAIAVPEPSLLSLFTMVPIGFYWRRKRFSGDRTGRRRA